MGSEGTGRLVRVFGCRLFPAVPRGGAGAVLSVS